MQVICLEEPAFYALVDQVVKYIKTTHQIIADKWVTPDDEAAKHIQQDDLAEIPG